VARLIPSLLAISVGLTPFFIEAVDLGSIPASDP
jgi:hypothetical protein